LESLETKVSLLEAKLNSIPQSYFENLPPIPEVKDYSEGMNGPPPPVH